MTDTTVYKIQVDGSSAVQTLDKLADAEDRVSDKASAMGDIMGTAIGFTIGSALTTAASAMVSFIGNLDDFVERGAAVGDVSEAFAKLTEKAGGTADVFIKQLNDATGETIDNFTLMKEANEALRSGMKPDEYIQLTKAARALSEETGQNLTESMNDLSNAFESGRVMGLKNRLGVIDIQKAETDLAKQLGVTRGELSKDGQMLAARTALLEASKRKTEEFGEVTNDAGDNIAMMSKLLADAKDRFFEALSNNVELNKAIYTLGELIKKTNFKPIIDGLVKIVEWSIKATSKIAALGSALIDNKLVDGLKSAGGAFAHLYDIVTGNDTLNIFKDDLGEVSKTAEIAGQSFKDVSSNINDLSDWMTIASRPIKETSAALAGPNGIETSSNKAAAGLDNLGKKAKEASDLMSPVIISAKRLNEESAKGGGSGQASGILDYFFDFDNQELEAQISKIESSFVNAIATIGDAMLKGVALHSADWANISGSIASSVADSFIPGTGPLADMAVKAIFSMFGGEDAGTTARKEADRFFADAFDANRLIVVVNGEMKKIKDLVFSNGGSFGSGEANDPFNFFKSLPAEAQAAFGGVGAAFEQLLGNAETIGGQIGAIFANNIGGSLQNLQVLVMATGKSFEDLEAAVVSAFMNGDLSAAEAASSLAGIQKLAQKGIPDALGATADAFQNMMDAGAEGGRFTVDSMRDIASEAKELGIKTLPELQAQLVASGRFTAESVQAFFTTLDKYGIKTVEGLENVADQAAIHILGTLETQNFPFAETQKKIDDITAAIEKIPQTVSRNLIFKMRVDGSAEDKRIVQTAKIEIPSGQGIQ